MPKFYLSALILCFASVASAQNTGPDVIVGDLQGLANYSHDPALGIDAFSVGTTSCNEGTTNLAWVSNTNQHPVIAQHAYRMHQGRFEQVGQSWLKHGFFALSQTLCGTCPNPTSGSSLGVGCSDPYTASLNGSQSGLGPKWEVNAFTGGFIYPFSNGTQGSQATSIYKRLQIHMSDLDPTTNNGARYFVEGHYITPDDALAGNGLNNVSWREVAITGNNSVGYDMNFIPGSGTTREEPAIKVWEALDPQVRLKAIDVPNEGRFWVGFRFEPLTNGNYAWEIAVHNLNSHLAAQGIEVELPPGAQVSNIGFHDVDYHSGEPFAGTDWTHQITANNTLLWQTDDFATDPNANALRWGTLYNFRFETDLPPHLLQVPAKLHLFRPNPVTEVNFSLDPKGGSVVALTGSKQGGNLGEVFPRPVQVRVFDNTGQLAVGQTVTFSVTSGDATILGSNVVTTDAMGVASVTVQAGMTPGPNIIEATNGPETTEIEVYTRRFESLWNPFSETLLFTTFTEWPGMLLSITWDVAPPAIPTPWGTLHSTVLAPGPFFGAISATGLVGTYDPYIVTDMNGNNARAYFNQGHLNGLGVTARFQCIGTYVDELGFQYYLSNPYDVAF